MRMKYTETVQKCLAKRSRTCANLFYATLGFCAFQVSISRANISQIRDRYSPSDLEKYVLQNSATLGLDTTPGNFSSGCDLWHLATRGPHASKLSEEKLRDAVRELETYNSAISGFVLSGDNRIRIRKRDKKACQALRIHPAGLGGIFTSFQLSKGYHGFMEPLLPPLRHLKFCLERDSLMDLSYLVHDFEAMCLTLSPASRVVFFDIGASLNFHSEEGEQPSMWLVNLYERFGFHFDHIYAFEKQPTSSEDVYRDLQTDMMASYHWINLGVEANLSSKLNPLNIILNEFTPDDFVVVKLDIDDPSIELSLANQLLRNERLHTLVDEFYFEHHVSLLELRDSGWGTNVNGSVGSSLKMFHELRSEGISAHYWV